MASAMLGSRPRVFGPAAPLERETDPAVLHASQKPARQAAGLVDQDAVGAFTVGIAVLSKPITGMRILAACLIMAGLVLMKASSATG